MNTEYPRVWIFDINRRVYGPDSLGPIWREHWYEVRVIGETRVSWVCAGGRKVPKKGGRGIAFDEQEINDLAWVIDNRVRISEAVRRIEDREVLGKIAALVGYAERGA